MMILIVHDALEVTIRIRLHINQINLASGVQSCAYHWLDVIRSAGKLLIQAADTEIDKLLAHSSANITKSLLNCDICFSFGCMSSNINMDLANGDK